MEFQFPDLEVLPPETAADTTGVLVTDLDHQILPLAQLYRDRGNCGNIFDEMKNQWGWCGFDAVTGLYGVMKRPGCRWWQIVEHLLQDDGSDGMPRRRPRDRLLRQVVGRPTTHGGQEITSSAVRRDKSQEQGICTRISC